MSISRGILQIIRILTVGTVAGFFLASAAPAGAATRIWDGGGADNNWMNAANWQNDDAPDPGDDLLFPANVVDTVMVNNFPAGTKFGILAFNGPYNVGGNRILIGNTIAHLGAGEVKITAAVTLEGGPGALGTITVTVEDLGSIIRIDGVIDGSGASLPATLRKNGVGLLQLSGANVYGGVTAVEAGELRIHGASALGAPAANTIVSDGAVLGVDLAANSVIAEPLLIAGQGTAAADDGALVFRSTATLGGTITLFGATTPQIVAMAGNAFIEGAIGGGNGFIKGGPGGLQLKGNNTYDGMTTVAAGSLQLGHAQALGTPSSGTTVLAGGSVSMLVPTIANEPLFAQANGSGIPVISCGPVICTWSGPIVVQGDNRFYSGAGSTLRLTGDISGIGSVSFSGSNGEGELHGNNTYAGRTVAGDIKLFGGHAIPDGTHLQLNVNATVRVNQPETVGALSGDGDDTLMLANFLTVDTSEPWPKFTGTISGIGGLIKKGTGTLTIDSAQLYLGLTTVEAGVFHMLSDTVLPGPVSVTGGVLRGVATLNNVLMTGGRVEPGQSPGILTANSFALLGGTLALELNGPAAGTQHDQLRVTTGGIALNNVTLELSAASVNAFSTPLVIVKNDGPNPVGGIFVGLPEGATAFPANGRAVRITYVGGDGNDIVLTPAESSYYLSEGATGPFFDTDILIANPNDTAVEATLTFLLPDGTTKAEARNVPARSRLTVKVDDIADLEATSVSTVVTSPTGLALVVERTMRWDASGYGAHTEKAVSGTSRHWYFAEGSQGFFSTYLLLANPQSSPNMALVQYLRENAPAITRQYPVAANSRFTVDVGADAELVGSSFGIHVAFDQPGVAERAMYFGGDPFWKAGHESAGVIEASPTWFLAEGATGPFFETFVLLANPGNLAAEATVTFLPDTGVPVVKMVPVPAFGRVTLNIEAEDTSLANAAVATQVSATQPILVERAQYWPDPAPQWYEAHNSFGVTATGTKWGLAEGRSGGDKAYQTYILLANPGTEKATVTVTFLREGQSPVERTYEVNPRSRYNVDTGAVSELAGLNFGALITSDQPIAVERAMYNNANGQLWAAGTNATGTPLP